MLEIRFDLASIYFSRLACKPKDFAQLVYAGWDAFAGEPPRRAVIAVYDSLVKVQALRDAPEYQALVSLRDKAADLAGIGLQDFSEIRPAKHKELFVGNAGRG